MRMSNQRWLAVAAIVALVGLVAVTMTGCEEDQEKTDPAQKTTPADRDADGPLKQKVAGDEQRPADQDVPTQPLKVDHASFDEVVLRSPVPVMVDFYADWCPPCRTLAPRLEELAEQYAGRAVVAKVDVDDNGELAAEYGVRGIPALFVIKDGEVVEDAVGLQSNRELQAMLDRHID